MNRSLIVAVASLVFVGVGCQNTDGAAPSTTPQLSETAPTVEIPAPPTPPPGASTLPPTTTAAPTTPPSTTAAPTTVATTLPATTTVPPTTAPPTTEVLAPPTTESLAAGELLLKPEGLGSALFGTEPESVIDYVTSILGNNTGDTGWGAADSFSDCLGTTARRVDWGVLSLIFTDQSPYGDGRRHFMGWEYGLVGQIGDEPQGLRTPGGNTLGSRVLDLRVEFPSVYLNEGDPQSNFPDNYYVNDAFWGLLSGVADDDFVLVMYGGYGCGE